MQKEKQFWVIAVLTAILLISSYGQVNAQVVSKKILRFSGNQQIGIVGSTLPMPFVVKIVDENENGIPGFPVTFSVIEGGGNLNGMVSTVVITDQQGLAQVTFTLGVTATTENKVQVNAEENGQPLTGSPIIFTAMSLSRAPGSLIKVSGDNQMGPADSQLPEPFAVMVVDILGNPIPGVPVTYSVTAGGGRLNTDAEIITVLTDTTGMARTYLTLGTVAGSNNNTVEAKAEHNGNPLEGSPVIFHATSISNQAHSMVKVSGDGQVVPVGSSLPEPFIVRIEDVYENGVPDFPVTFTVIEGGGNLNGVVRTVLTDQVGLASLSLNFEPSEPTTLKVMVIARENDMHLMGSPILFTAIFESVHGGTIIKITGDNQRGPAGSQLPVPLTVKVIDKYENPIPDFPVIFSITHGKGKLNDQQATSITSLTNPEGFANVLLTLGSTPTAEVHVMAEAAGLKESPIYFTAYSFLPNSFKNALVLNRNWQYCEIPDRTYLNFGRHNDFTLELLIKPYMYTVHLGAHSDSIKLYPSNLMSKLDIDFSVQPSAGGFLRGWWFDIFGKTTNPLVNGYFNVDPLDEVIRFGEGGPNSASGWSLGVSEDATLDFLYTFIRNGISWYHIAFAYTRQPREKRLSHNGNTLHHYILNNIDCDISAPNTPLLIGSLPISIDSILNLSYCFKGQIDEVRIWDYVRSIEQIMTTMIDTLGPEYYTTADSGLLAYYRFDQMENLGVGGDGLANDVRDLTYNANHGNLIGGATITNTSTIIEFSKSGIPDKFAILQNYPNPFNPSTTIRYYMLKSEQVTLKVYDILGREIEALVDGYQLAGDHKIIWTAKELTSGIYLCRLQTDELVQTIKMVFQK